MAKPAPKLSEAHLAALEFANALVMEPANISDDLSRRLRQHFSKEQIIELALDVMKWSYQKVPVALGVDRAIRPGELTDLAFDSNGNWIRPG
ncbi:MAG: hypothetical protein AB8G14_01910 [Ilumatobacter sp.]